jgi:quercetin dioxygenase-like cupin family protein
MENSEFENSKMFNIAGLLEYVPHSIVIKSIIKKTTCNVSAASMDTGQILTGKISPFENFVQIIDGNAEIIINEISNLVETGQSIIIPANTRNTIKANARLKMLSTVLKSGYEENSFIPYIL